jgi:molybdopterin converting factor small subunit
MRVSVRCFGTFQKFQKGTKPWEMPEGATINEITEILGLDSEEVQLAFLNHKEVPLDTLLHEGDEVALSPKTGGM